MRFFATNRADDERDQYRPSRQLGLRTLLAFALWFGGALLVTAFVASALRASHVSHRAAAEYQPPTAPPTFYRRGMGADGR